jgi:hypothetical protein
VIKDRFGRDRVETSRDHVGNVDRSVGTHRAGSEFAEKLIRTAKDWTLFPCERSR